MKKILIILVLPLLALTLSAYTIITPRPNYIVRPVIDYNSGYVGFDQTNLDTIINEINSNTANNSRIILLTAQFNRATDFQLINNYNPTVIPNQTISEVYGVDVFMDVAFNQAYFKTKIIFYDFKNEIILILDNLVFTSTTFVKNDVLIKVTYNPVSEYNQGFSDARYQYGFYDPSQNKWYTSEERYQLGLTSSQGYYGYYDSLTDTYLTAEQYGYIRFNEGLESNNDFLSLFLNAMTLPAILFSIEIFPNFKLGYFIMFPLLLGLTGWFVYLVARRGK